MIIKVKIDGIKNIDISLKPLKTIVLFWYIEWWSNKKIMTGIKLLDDWLANAQLVRKKTHGITKYYFWNFTSPLKFASKIYNKNLTLQEAKDNQQKLKILINRLNNDYNPRN